MIKFVTKRLFHMVFVLFGVSLFTYIVTTSAAGAAMGMEDKTPFFFRYLPWLRAMLFFEKGYVSPQRRTMLSTFLRMIPGTIRLAGISLFVVFLISFPLGLLAAMKKDSVFDYAVRFFTFAGASVPNYTLALLFIFTMAVGLRWFPVLSDGSPRGAILPVCSLVIPLISRYLRYIRGVTLETLHQEYIVGAQARGIRWRRILLFHILPNTMPPILSFLGISVGHLLGGIAIIETIFSWRGVGAIAVSAIRARDYPVIQAYILWMAILYVGADFLIDLIRHISDPQLRRKERTA